MPDKILVYNKKTDTYEISLDNSALSDARACLRKFAHGYIDWLRPRSNILSADPNLPPSTQALYFGTAIHSICDAWWQRAQLERCEELFIEDYGRYASHESYKDERRSVDQGISLIRTYNAAWLFDRDKYELMSSEFAIRQFLGRWTSPSGKKYKFFYRGRIDKVLRNLETGEIEIIDHKTTTKYRVIAELYQISQPFLGYLWATKQIFGETPSMIWADMWMLKKNGVTPQREQVNWKSWKISEWKDGAKRQFIRIARALEEHLETKSYAPFDQTSESCDDWFTKCQFFPLCNTAPKYRDGLIKAQYQHKGEDHLDV